MKNLVLCDSSGKVLFLSDTYEGRVHDKAIADDNRYTLPPGSLLFQDAGFQGFAPPGVTIIQPVKKPRGAPLSSEDKARNAAINRVRVHVEHVISGIKRYRLVKDVLRLWRDDVRDRVMLIACGLHNFRLNYRPWPFLSLYP